jgi:putative ABC transport system permease protein
VALFRWFILRRLGEEPVRAWLTVAGIALGIAVVLAIQMANASSLAGFSAALDAVAGRTSLEIIGAGAGIEEHRLRGLGWLRAYGDISPVIEGDGAIRTATMERTEAVRLLGVDVLRDLALRDYRLAGLDSAEPESPRALLDLLIDARSVVLTQAFAARYAVAVGDSVELALGDRLQRFHVQGLLTGDGPARTLGGNFVLMDIAAAQLALDRLGRVDRVDIRLRDASDLDTAEREIAERLPDGLSVQRPARRGAQVEKMLAAFHFNLSALSLVALLVGVFLVYNTVATSVIARRDEIGVLRALGTPRRTVGLLFVGEAVVLAVVGATLGIPLGWALAWGAVGLTSSTVTTLYVAEAAALPALAGWQVVLAFGVGLGLSIIAAIAPAREAARATPLDALRGVVGADVPEGTRGRPLLVAGGLLVVAAVTSQLGPVAGRPVFGFVSALAVVFGLAFLVPSALSVLGRAGRPLVARLGVAARLAHANLSGSRSRLSVSVAALAVSLAMLVAIAVMIGSFRKTVIYWVGQTLQADLYVATARRSNLESQTTISDALESVVVSDPAVAAVDRFRALSLPYKDRLIVLGAGEFDVLLKYGNLVFKAPDAARDAMQAAIGRDAVVVSEAFAMRFDVAVGQRVMLVTPGGPRPFDVAAVYYDYSTDRGVVVMDRRTFRRHWGELRPTSLTVYLREGADPEETRARLLATLGDDHRVFIHTNASLRGEVLRIFDSTFAVTYALEAIAILVAILGITATLTTLAIERRRELAVLRLVGAESGQVRRMVMLEAGLLGLVSQALGLATGFLLAVILIYVINVQSFGWTIQFHAPLAFLLQTTVVLLVVTTLAGVYPARVASAGQPIDEVAEE